MLVRLFCIIPNEMSGVSVESLRENDENLYISIYVRIPTSYTYDDDGTTQHITNSNKQNKHRYRYVYIYICGWLYGWWCR